MFGFDFSVINDYYENPKYRPAIHDADNFDMAELDFTDKNVLE